MISHGRNPTVFLVPTANIKKEDRLIITGMKSSKQLPNETRQKIEALKIIATEIYEVLIPYLSAPKL
jgi:hypothetical protein